MFLVVLLTFADGSGVRAPVHALCDALTTRGAKVRTVTVDSAEDIDEVLAEFDGPARPDGLCWPTSDASVRLAVAVAADGQLRAVLRRMVRRYAPPPRRRPDDLPAGRTVPDLPPVGLLPLGPPAEDGLATRLGLAHEPAAVAAALLAGHTRRLDLLRTDAGTVTVDGALLGGTGATGAALRWHARVEVDDAVLSDGTEPLLACAVATGTKYSTVDGLPLVAPDPSDGALDVAVALPTAARRLLRRPQVRVEVRRARGRAVAVTPVDGEVPYLDDGVVGELGRKRSWWIEPGVWAVYE